MEDVGVRSAGFVEYVTPGEALVMAWIREEMLDEV